MKYLLSLIISTWMINTASAQGFEEWLNDDILFDNTDEISTPQSSGNQPAQTNSEQIKSNNVETTEQSENLDEQNNTQTPLETTSQENLDQETSNQIENNDSQTLQESQLVDEQNTAQEKTLDDVEENKLDVEENKLDDVVVTGEIDKTTMTEDTEKLFSMPGASGDPLKALEALPGITSEFSFVGAPSVRGSAPEDNSYLVDNLPIANLYHLLGYSIFSDNIVQNFDIQTGAFPAKYSGGTGAAIYVDLRQPKNKQLTWTIDLGMFHSGFFVESKINENQSVYFGARKSTISYFAPFIMPLFEEDEKNTEESEEEPAVEIAEFPNSDDLYFKYHNKINDQHQVSVLVLGAQDYFGIKFPEGSEVEAQEPALIGTLAANNKQATSGITWNYKIDQYNQLNTSIGHLFFNSEFILGKDLFNNLDVNSLIAKTAYEKSDIESHVFTSGLAFQSDNAVYTSRLLNNPCSRLDPGCSFSAGTIIETGDDMTINYTDAYVQDQWFLNDQWTWINGLHLSYDDYIEDIIWQPRSKLEFNYFDEWIFNAAFGVHHQFPEITNLLPEFGNPNLKNITAEHYVLSLEKNTYSGLKVKTDAYFKKINNIVLATNDERLYSNEASGEAYGVELLLDQEKVGAFSGFIALSLSKSTRTNEITNVTSQFELDKPFVLDWVLNYEPNDRWKIGSKWNLKSGNLYTPIIGSKPFEDYPDSFEPIYGEVNSKRLPMTHQLDLRIEYKKKDSKKDITYYVDILNVYNHKNVEGYSYNDDYSEIEEETGGTPILPLFGMKMTF